MRSQSCCTPVVDSQSKSCDTMFLARLVEVVGAVRYQVCFRSLKQNSDSGSSAKLCVLHYPGARAHTSGIRYISKLRNSHLNNAPRRLTHTWLLSWRQRYKRKLYNGENIEKLYAPRRVIHTWSERWCDNYSKEKHHTWII